MSKSETKFMHLVKIFSEMDNDIFLGKMMSAPGLKYKDKVFAFYTKDDAMGFRLGPDFVPKEHGLKYYQPLSPFKTKPPLKEWLIIDNKHSDKWENLTQLSLTYTKTL